MIKVQSKTGYIVGSIVYDDNTGEIFEVVSCVKFIFNTNNNYGVTLKPVTKLQ